MKYSDNYSEVFSSTRYKLRHILLEYYEHIRDCNKHGVHVSFITISSAADNLTAYNEMLPWQSFMSFKIITK